MNISPASCLQNVLQSVITPVSNDSTDWSTSVYPLPPTPGVYLLFPVHQAYIHDLIPMFTRRSLIGNATGIQWMKWHRICSVCLDICCLWSTASMHNVQYMLHPPICPWMYFGLWYAIYRMLNPTLMLDMPYASSQQFIRHCCVNEAGDDVFRFSLENKLWSSP
jgi:hypothetical protein